MKTGVAGRETELPAAVVELVDAFSRSHGGAAVRIWAERNGGWDPLLAVPAGCEAAADPARLRVLGRGLGLPLAVEVDEGVGEANAEFLAAVLDRMLSYEAETRQAAEELAERYEEINLLYSISEILGSVLPLRAAASRILEEVADVLGARRASLWAYEPESGTLHLAAAAGARVVGLYGPTPPERNGPWHADDLVVSRPEACECVFERRCTAARWCLGDVTVEEVSAAVAQRLQRPARRAPIDDGRGV